MFEGDKLQQLWDVSGTFMRHVPRAKCRGIGTDRDRGIYPVPLSYAALKGTRLGVGGPICADALAAG